MRVFMDFEKIKAEVKTLLGRDNTGHGFDHVEKVYRNAMKLCNTMPEIDREVVGLAALLHDCDDYKLFGDEGAGKLPNARRIMTDCSVSATFQDKVCAAIGDVGYSKRLNGNMPVTAEGRIVSDADMLEAMGATGIIRCMAYALARCTQYGTPLFDAEVWPEPDMSAEEYKKPDRRSDNFINHFFEKMLKLKNLLLTEAGKAEGEKRHEFMVAFLRRFFDEYDAADWQEYLDAYMKIA